MKKILTLAVLPLLMCVACSNASVEEKTQKLNDDLKAAVDNYHAAVGAIQADTTLTMEQLSESIEKEADKTIDQMKSICFKAIKKNRNNEVAVEAIKNIYEYLEPEELEKAIASLGPDNLENPVIQKITSRINSKKSTAEGMMFVDFEIDGVKFSDYIGRGKTVLVDFWASWCGPCKREIPNIAHVYETYAGEDFDVLSIAVWDKPEDTIEAASAHGVVWNQIINAQQVPTELYGIDGIPQIMLFGPDGTILKRDLRGAAIEAAVKEALGR